MEDLRQLADLLDARNAVDREIAGIIGRPAHTGHIGDFIAARIFDIELETAANRKGVDGRFRSGPLAGRSVNVKFRTGNDGLLDINPAALPDVFLVLAGPKVAPVSSRGGVSQVVVAGVFAFESAPLMEALARRHVRIGIATSVIRALWDAAEIFPAAGSRLLPLTGQQREALALFS